MNPRDTSRAALVHEKQMQLKPFGNEALIESVPACLDRGTR
jgi:hypothetical protein